MVVDRFTKYAHFLPLKHPYTAQSVSRTFLDNVVKHHGLPKSIVIDRDRVFLNAFWKELFKLYDVKLARSTAYHPQTDGQTERVNQCLEMYLRCMTQAAPTKWISLAELWYNSSFHTALHCSPFKALYGYDPTVGTVPLLPTDGDQSVREIVQERQLQLEGLKEQLAAAQNCMKLQADKNRTDLHFQVGELVLLKLQPYAQSSVVN